MKNWKLIDDYPPPLIRCLARQRLRGKRIRAVSDEEIAIRADLPVYRVQEIYKSPSWDPVPVGEMRKFCHGCDFDPENRDDRNRATAYKNQKGGAKFTYLKESAWWDSVFRPLLTILAKSYEKEST